MYRHNRKVPRDRKDVDAKIVKSIVNQYRKIYSNKQIYTALNLPKTTFYRWLNSSDKEISEEEKSIIDTCKINKYRYGYRKVHAVLKSMGFNIYYRLVSRKMHKQNILAKVRRKKRKFNS